LNFLYSLSETHVVTRQSRIADFAPSAQHTDSRRPRARITKQIRPFSFPVFVCRSKQECFQLMLKSVCRRPTQKFHVCRHSSACSTFQISTRCSLIIAPCIVFSCTRRRLQYLIESNKERDEGTVVSMVVSLLLARGRHSLRRRLCHAFLVYNFNSTWWHYLSLPKTLPFRVSPTTLAPMDLLERLNPAPNIQRIII